MTSRERVLIALRGGTPDRVPVWEYLFSLKLMKEVMGYTTELYDGKTQAQMAAKMGLDVIWAPVNGFCGIEDSPHSPNEIYQDEWGVTYQKNGWPIIAQVNTPIKSREDWNNYKIPHVNTPGRLKILKDAIGANESGLAVTAGFLGPFTMMSWYLMDFETLSMSIFMDPELVHEMTGSFVGWALEAAELAYSTGGVDAFHISDDWGGTAGLLISPDHFREFFLRPFKKLVSGLKSYGVPVIMHNDGNLWEILDDLVATGIDAYHPVERAATMDLISVKRKYNGRICPIGNVNNKTTMVTGTPEDVVMETLECLGTGAPGGGYILSTDHSLHDDISLENSMALIETVHKFGKYPFNPQSISHTLNDKR
jgi:uroporphyrinogen decarboxylase